MSNGSLKPYQLDFSEVARQNIRDSHSDAEKHGHGPDFTRILTVAVNKLRTNPLE